MSEQNKTLKLRKNFKESELKYTEKSIEILQEDGKASENTTYELFLWLLSYSKTLICRISKDSFISFIRCFCPTFPLPHHIAELTAAQYEYKTIGRQHSSPYNRSLEKA